MPRPRTPRITMPTKYDEDLKAYVLRDECPACGSPHHLTPSPATADLGYHDEAFYIIDNESRTAWLRYEKHSCGNCGCEFQIIIAPAAIRITRDPDIKEGLRGYDL